MGDWRDANVVHEAGMLNEKPILSLYKPSLLTEEKYTMCEVSSPNVIVTSVKRAEDESGLIVRMYESNGLTSNFALCSSNTTALSFCSIISHS